MIWPQKREFGALNPAIMTFLGAGTQPAMKRSGG
jgi:hypothetical protein